MYKSVPNFNAIYMESKNLCCSAGTDFLYNNDNMKLNLDSELPVHTSKFFVIVFVFLKVNRVGVTQTFNKGETWIKIRIWKSKSGINFKK